jgi:rubrerythrin
MRERGYASGTGLSEVVLYKEALEAEREHYEFYRKKTDRAGSDAERQMFLVISAEERRHALVLRA